MTSPLSILIRWNFNLCATEHSAHFFSILKQKHFSTGGLLWAKQEVQRLVAGVSCAHRGGLIYDSTNLQHNHSYCTKLPPCTLRNLSVVGSNHELHTWNRFTTYRFKRTIFVHRKDYSSNMTISKFHLSNKDTTTFYVLPASFLTQEPSSFHRLTSPLPPRWQAHKKNYELPMEIHKFPESFLLNKLKTDSDRDFSFQEQKSSELYQKIITEGIKVISSVIFSYFVLFSIHTPHNQKPYNLTIIYQIIPPATLQRQLDVLYQNYNDITKIITVQLNSKKCQEEPVQQNFLDSVPWTLNAI